MAETTTPTPTLKAAAYTAGGTVRDSVDLPVDLFDGTINMPVMHQAVKAFLGNQRLGLAYTKTRGLVTGGNQKPWKQKGTGRARQGSRRAPHFVGGGTVFGPTGRKYNQTVPRQIRALARKSALNARARENALIVIDNFNYDAPSTKQMVSLLAALDVTNKKVLILTDGLKPNVFLSGRNLQRTHVMPYADVSTYHILWSDVVLVESNALGYELASVDEKPRAARPKSETKSRGAEKAERKTAKAATKSSNAHKTARKAAKAAGKSAKPKTKSAKKPSAKKSTGKKKGK
ncbi:MAG TPA: 50S ribosomal protein L4 [Gemmatimonadaceae bacterium]|jgi:large subunit ribosomal protein L4|nr:50S ribosomal protein L4 [Gemmatimonadaceae bacterium]